MKLPSLVAFALPGVLAATGGRCPPTGAVLPPPHIPSSFNTPGLRPKLDSLRNNTALGWNLTTTSFSVTLTSENETFFEYHHTAPVRSQRGGVSKVDGDTVYRIMSVTKVFNVLALLLTAPRNLDDPISKYVPELDGVEEYEDITLRMLAGQLSGVPRNGRAFDLYDTYGDALIKAGFPTPDPKDVPTCDTVTSGTCNRTEFFDNLLKDDLDWLPGDKVAYSNQAYTLLGFALQNMTGKSFTELINDKIAMPLNLSSTGIDAPDLSRGIIPVGQGQVFYGFDLGNFNATAGIYSTPNDLTSFVRSILTSKLLTPAQTRQWLKPGAFAGGYTTAVGAPWEIYRLTNLTPDKRVIDVYTKSGDLPGYSVYMLMLPDYSVGATVMVAGADAYAPSELLLDVVTKALVPAVDSLAREQARAVYTGRYTGASGTGNHTNNINGTNSTNSTASSLDLIIDNGPGLKIKRWINNGKSILQALAANQGVPVQSLDARLYPVGEKNRWRLSFETIGTGKEDLSAPSKTCHNWFQVDALRWASLPVDEFQFNVENGIVKGVRNLGLRANLSRQNVKGRRLAPL
ncbi:Beta-lactamase-like protein [Cladobotryum mycophilum]|uniref:Beta-lactamase-like protein n=1 Tax=Cladobotryum mycophilum TaxID=491253 RepID=A0ABR0SJF5_9HYPO